MKRKSPLAGLSDKGFSFDLVSRKKDEDKTETFETSQAERIEEPLDLSALPEDKVQLLRPEEMVAETPVVAETPELTNADPVATEPKISAPDTPPEPKRRLRSTSRVKTTFLGFERSDGRIEDVFETSTDNASDENSIVMFPVGWLLVVSGPGRGASYTLQPGVSQIGRGDDQSVQLDFGDNGISRQNHAAIAFDPEENKFFLGHGGKSNLVRLNGKPVLSTEEVRDKDLIKIGETTLRFVALCGDEFSWAEEA